MPPAGRRSAAKRAPKNGGIGSAVLHHCLRQQAENAQRHHEFILSLKRSGEEKSVEDAGPAGVAFGGSISRHRTLEFLSGSLTAENPSKGSAQLKYKEQNLRSVLERSGLDEYLCTALAAQDSFAVDRYEARLLQGPTAPSLRATKPVESCRVNAQLLAEGGDVPIPRRPIFFSKDEAAKFKEAEQREAPSAGAVSRNRRRRNRARVKLLLAGKVEEATIYNVRFVKQQRDELHRRFQKPKEPKGGRRRGNASSKAAAAESHKLADAAGAWETEAEAQWGSECSQSEAEQTDETESDLVHASQSHSQSESESESETERECSSSGLSSASDSEVSAAEGESAACSPAAEPAPQLPRTAVELDEVEHESFLQWRRSLAKMEDGGSVLTPYERNLEVWRQLWRVVERSHLILQIVDGRSPAFFRCKDLEKYVGEVSPDKRVVLVINKSDLLPPAVRAEWSRYFAANGVTAVFFSALRELTQQKADAEAQFVSEADGGADDWGSSETERMGEADEGRPSKPSATDNSASVDGSNEDILSCESLVKLLIQYRDEHRAALAARQSADESEALEDFVVGTVGYPNVGKSSLINAVLGLKKVSVSQQPGKTRRLQTIPLKGRGITLCDCPGLVFPKTVTSKHILVLNGVVPVDEMRGDYISSIQLVCDWIPKTLLRHYGITADAYREAQKTCRIIRGPQGPRGAHGNETEGLQERLDASCVLVAVAAQRHFVSGGKGGQLDLYRVAKLMLRDFTTGRLLRCHLPGGGVFAGDAEAAEAGKFLSVVQRSMESLLERAGGGADAAWGAVHASRQRVLPTSVLPVKQISPTKVLQELEEDLDLLEVIENGEATKAVGGRVSYAMTKRKARQMQKQLLKGKGTGLSGYLNRR